MPMIKPVHAAGESPSASPRLVRRPSRSMTSSRPTARATARSARSTASRSTRRPARSSACSDRTAPASRPPSRSSPRSRAPTPASPASAGTDVTVDPDTVRRAIGYVSQKPGFDPTATGRENLVLQGRVHGLPGPAARDRADDLLQRFGLGEAADRVTDKWSGGMQRKLDVAMGLVHRPTVLFLDEPTTGLDPEARAELWAEIADAGRRRRADRAAHDALPRRG